MKKCIGCREYKRCRDSFASWIFFIVGLAATVAIRVVTVLIHVDPIYAKIAWYAGVGGFFIFFVYKFRVNQARAKLIDQQGLADKINDKEQLTEDDYSLIGVILCALSSRKERVNYFFIFFLSALALLLAIYMDFLK
ncbi:MAG: hypothetical protein HQ579_01230 [Candidatus Omnitrophica bacterium]|nr:hypothetical protein [Candidatus Omnitrophota bacterium]